MNNQDNNPLDTFIAIMCYMCLAAAAIYMIKLALACLLVLN